MVVRPNSFYVGVQTEKTEAAQVGRDEYSRPFDRRRLGMYDRLARSNTRSFAMGGKLRLSCSLANMSPYM